MAPNERVGIAGGSGSGKSTLLRLIALLEKPTSGSLRLFGEDVMAIENTLLLKFLSHVPYISSTNGTPRGLKLAIANHELYLDVTAEVVAKYKDELTEKILAVGRELDGLNSRMMNPNYVERAPVELVRETRNLIAEKEKLIEEMKMQLNVI